MRRNAIVAALLLTSLLGLAARAEEPGIDPRAQAVLERAVASMGGDDALAAVKAMRFEAEGTYASGTTPPMPYRATTTCVLPDRVLWRLDAGMFQGAMGIDGPTAWSQMMSPPARLRGAAATWALTWKRTFEVTLVRPLLHHAGLRVAHVAEDGEQDTLRATFEDDEAWVLDFATRDGKTFLARFQGPMTHMDGRPGRFDSTLSAPRTYGPITMPSVVENKTFVGEDLRETVRETTTSVAWNPELEDGLFAMPEPALELGVVRVVAQPSSVALAATLEGPYEGIGASIARLNEVAGARSLMPTGAPVAVFVRTPEDVEDPAGIRTRILLPVALAGPRPTDLPDGVALVDLPAQEVARLYVRGPYGTADVAAIGTVRRWIVANGYRATGEAAAAYHHDPAATVPEDQVTEVRIPVEKVP